MEDCSTDERQWLYRESNSDQEDSISTLNIVLNNFGLVGAMILEAQLLNSAKVWSDGLTHSSKCKFSSSRVFVSSSTKNVLVRGLK